MSRLIPTIGLEIHIRLKTKSKMYCHCLNEQWDNPPNTNVCPICLGLPGTLPVPNREAIRKAIILGLALEGKIAAETRFDRKHYFYPDLPKDYQISQYDQPLISGGRIVLSDGKVVGLKRIHLEEDAGKLVHPASSSDSLVDLNRAGTPLVEVVTEPDIESSGQAMAAVRILRDLVRHYDISSGDMEKGFLRCDANISLSAEGTVGTPVEVKNLNSFKMIGRALDHEIKRQEESITRGEKVAKETRGWIDRRQVTVSQRGKEYAHDYRYFPEPDIPPLHPAQLFDLDQLKAGMIASPDQISKELEKAGVPQQEILVLTRDPARRKYLQALEAAGISSSVIKTAAQWIVNVDFQPKIPPEIFAALMEKWGKRELPKNQVIEVARRLATGESSDNIVNLPEFKANIGEDKINLIIDQVISENPQALKAIRSGKPQAIGFLIGQVMRQVKGAYPQEILKLIKVKLKE